MDPTDASGASAGAKAGVLEVLVAGLARERVREVQVEVGEAVGGVAVGLLGVRVGRRRAGPAVGVRGEIVPVKL